MVTNNIPRLNQVTSWSSTSSTEMLVGCETFCETFGYFNMLL